MALTNEEMAKEITVAFCTRLKEISHYDLPGSEKANATAMGKAIGQFYLEILKAVNEGRGG